MKEVHRALEPFGLYISIVFRENLNREPAWGFVINTVNEELYKSGRYGTYEEAQKAGLTKAVCSYLNAIEL